MDRRQFLKDSIAAIALFYFPDISEKQELFPYPKELESMVNFWIKIFTEYNSDQFVVHDLWDLDIIYDVIDFPVLNYLTGEQYKEFMWGNGKEGDSLKDYLNPLRKAYKERLTNLSNNINLNNLNEKEKKLHLKLKKTLEDKLQESNLSSKLFYKQKSDNIHVQWAQADRTKAAFERSGMYTKMIEEIFKENNIPSEIKWLPVIESGFDNNAASKYALGMWQFTRSAAREVYFGKRLRNIKDPVASTLHAAGKLKHNYELFESWPLAMMAYHHGITNVKRAHRKFGKNLVNIIFKYESGSFGFASRNYYPEFLAVLEIVNNLEEHYGNIAFMDPIDFKKPEIRKKYAYTERKEPKKNIPENGINHKAVRGDNLWDLSKEYDVPFNEVKKYNDPDIKPGDIVFIPGPKTNPEHKQEIKFSEEDYFMYKPRRGDTLEKWERRFGVPREELLKLNPGIRRPEYIIYRHKTYKIPNKQ